MDHQGKSNSLRSFVRRRLRFSLKTLFAVMTLLALWLGYVSHSAHQQKQAVDAILEAGGSFFYAHQRLPDTEDGSRVVSSMLEPRAPRWLVSWAGVDYFSSVSSVTVLDTPITDDWLVQLDKLPGLGYLTLHGTNVTSQGIVRLRGLRRLEVLNIRALEGVSDDTLRAIGECTRLKFLDLRDCHEITDEGVAHLAPLVNLERLNLISTQLTDAGMLHLSRCTKMSHLWLNNTQVTDESLRHIANMKDIYWLDLRGTRVTDEGMHHLEGLTKLSDLILWDTKVTRSGVARIEATLPNMLIGIGTDPTRQGPSSP